MNWRINAKGEIRQRAAKFIGGDQLYWKILIQNAYLWIIECVIFVS